MKKINSSLFLIVAFILCVSTLQAQIISTIVGTGVTTFAGDGGAATLANINEPSGLAYDSHGNIFVMDQYNYRVRRVTPSGIISTVVGTGSVGYSGDGGQATNATIGRCIGIAIDGHNNLYIADYDHSTIRKIDTTGIINTIAGTVSTAGFAGDGGLAVSAKLNHPTALCFDQNQNLFIADYVNCRIRKIDTNGYIWTVAGSATLGSAGDGGPATLASLHYPFGVSVDIEGNIYISDQNNEKVRLVTPAGIISTFAGTGVIGPAGDGGQATAAQLSNPCAVAFDGSGNVYIADQVNNKVRVVSTATGVIKTFVGTGASGFGGDGGPATAAEINSTSDILMDPFGNLLICDNNNQRIRKVSICVNPIITQPISDTVTAGATSQFYVAATAGSTYQWQEDPGTGFVNLSNVWPYSGVTTDTLKISNTSIYLNLVHYRCIVSYGSCTDTTTGALLSVSPSTGLSGNTDLDNFIRVYPNPTSSEIRIMQAGNSGELIGDVDVMDALGNKLISTKLTKGFSDINMSELSAGIYFLRANVDGNYLYRKIIKI
jgi:Secretion system C-terminal sorting domain